MGHMKSGIGMQSHSSCTVLKNRLKGTPCNCAEHVFTCGSTEITCEIVTFIAHLILVGSFIQVLFKFLSS